MVARGAVAVYTAVMFAEADAVVTAVLVRGEGFAVRSRMAASVVYCVPAPAVAAAERHGQT